MSSSFLLVTGRDADAAPKGRHKLIVRGMQAVSFPVKVPALLNLTFELIRGPPASPANEGLYCMGRTLSGTGP